MTTNAIAISRNLVASGLELNVANAIAEVMDRMATKDALDKLSQKVDGIDRKVDLLQVDMDRRFDLMQAEMDRRFDLMQEKITALNASAKEQKNMMFGLYIGLTVVFVATIIG